MFVYLPNYPILDELYQTSVFVAMFYVKILSRPGFLGGMVCLWFALYPFSSSMWIVVALYIMLETMREPLFILSYKQHHQFLEAVVKHFQEFWDFIGFLHPKNVPCIFFSSFSLLEILLEMFWKFFLYGIILLLTLWQICKWWNKSVWMFSVTTHGRDNLAQVFGVMP